jgi:hypothetical protein
MYSWDSRVIVFGHIVGAQGMGGVILFVKLLKGV